MCGATFSLERMSCCCFWLLPRFPPVCACSKSVSGQIEDITDTIALVLLLSGEWCYVFWCNLASCNLVLKDVKKGPMIVGVALGLEAPFYSSDTCSVCLAEALALLGLIAVNCWGVILHIPSIRCTETRDQQQLERTFKPTDPPIILQHVLL